MDNSLRNALVFAILPAVAVVIGGVTFFYKPPTPRLLGRLLKRVFDIEQCSQCGGAALIAQAGKPGPGWVFVSDIQSATKIT